MELDRHELTYAPEHGAMFTVSVEPHGHSVHLRLQGELDMATSPVLEAWLLEAERETTDIGVDLENVTFIDSSGIHAFQRAADRATDAGRGFTLRKAPRIVRRVFQLTNSTHLLAPIHAAFSPTTVERPAPGVLPGCDEPWQSPLRSGTDLS